MRRARRRPGPVPVARRTLRPRCPSRRPRTVRRACPRAETGWSQKSTTCCGRCRARGRTSTPPGRRTGSGFCSSGRRWRPPDRARGGCSDHRLRPGGRIGSGHRRLHRGGAGRAAPGPGGRAGRPTYGLAADDAGAGRLLRPHRRRPARAPRRGRLGPASAVDGRRGAAGHGRRPVRARPPAAAADPSDDPLPRTGGSGPSALPDQAVRPRRRGAVTAGPGRAPARAVPRRAVRRLRRPQLPVARRHLGRPPAPAAAAGGPHPLSARPVMGARRAFPAVLRRP